VPAADREIALDGTNLRQRPVNSVGGNTFLVRRKPTRLTAGRVDHVTTQEDYAFRWLVCLS
jgi:hypothetical protein